MLWYTPYDGNMKIGKVNGVLNYTLFMHVCMGTIQTQKFQIEIIFQETQLYKMDYSVSENFGSNIYIHPEFNINQTRFHSCHFLHSKLKFYPNLD